MSALAYHWSEELYDLRGTYHPDPEAAAVRLGLVLNPEAGAAYAFDGETVTYDALLPLHEQRKLIARAVVASLACTPALAHRPLLKPLVRV